MSDADDTTLRLERLIASPPDLLFALWIEPDQVAKWWAPDGYEGVVDMLDVRVGGRWRTIMRRPDGGEVATSGVYRVVDPPHRLVFTWAWEDAERMRGHETEVSVSFEPAPGGTRLVLVQQRFESRQSCDNHARGWSATFDRMAKMGGQRREGP
jgi:uncharacterized protein YndB with AHSA1/START domain